MVQFDAATVPDEIILQQSGPKHAAVGVQFIVSCYRWQLPVGHRMPHSLKMRAACRHDVASPGGESDCPMQPRSSHSYSTLSYRSTAASFSNFVNICCQHTTLRAQHFQRLKAAPFHNPACCGSSGCQPSDPRGPPATPAVPGAEALPAASDMTHTMFTRHRDVLFYVPNLIGEPTADGQ